MNPQRIVFSRLLPFAAYILLLALDSTIANLLSTLHIDARNTYVIRILIVLALLIYYWRDYIELIVKPKASDFFYAAISGCIVFIIWIFPYPDWLGGGDVTGFNPIEQASQVEHIFWVSMRLMGAAMIVPIVEELFWRSYIMRWFDSQHFLTYSPERISGYAYFGSACLFAIEHHLWLAGLFAGLVYGELYKTYKNLWVPIFAHAVTNSVLGIWVVWCGQWNYW